MGINLLEKFFPAKTTITSATIKAEIDYSESEIKHLQAEIGPKLAAIATMTDAEHVKAEAEIASTKRAIARMDSRIAVLAEQLPVVLAAEEASAKAEVDAALRARAEACRKAANVEAKSLLKEYDSLAERIATVISRVAAIEMEVNEVNKALRANRVAEDVQSVAQTWRTTPGTEATEQRAKVPCWVYRYPGSPADTEKTKYRYEAPREEVRRATIGPDGKPVPGATEIHNYYGREIVIVPKLEKREMVVSKTRPQPPRYEDSLEGVRLPPAFAGGKWHWPRA